MSLLRVAKCGEVLISDDRSHPETYPLAVTLTIDMHSALECRTNLHVWAAWYTHYRKA
jgi:hypothetical protein